MPPICPPTPRRPRRYTHSRSRNRFQFTDMTETLRISRALQHATADEHRERGIISQHAADNQLTWHYSIAASAGGYTPRPKPFRGVPYTPSCSYWTDHPTPTNMTPTNSALASPAHLGEPAKPFTAKGITTSTCDLYAPQPKYPRTMSTLLRGEKRPRTLDTNAIVPRPEHKVPVYNAHAKVHPGLEPYSSVPYSAVPFGSYPHAHHHWSTSAPLPR